MAATANTELIKFVPEATLKDMSGQIFFIIYKNLAPGNFVPVYKSETKASSGGKIIWNMVQIGSTDLCKDDIEREVKIEFFRFNSSGSHKIIGTCSTITLGVLKEKKQDYPVTPSGTLKLNGVVVEKVNSFLEYVFGGCQIDLSIAIDFTLSNGDPRQQNSLHYFDPQRNQYLQAIRNVGEILQYYNTDKQIALYGFGGAIPPYTNRASHCFALNGDIFNPRVNGLEAVVSCYQNALQTCPLYGPTHFGDILNQVVSKVEADRVDQNNQKFSILLLITDGIINDMAKTVDQIVRGSKLPLGIIIVGVGEADFSNMDTLDGDEQALYSNAYRQYAAADIVQFVPFNDFKSNPHLLAKETLNEIPGQLLNYFRKNNITPYQRTEAQRQMLQNQLSMRTGM